MPRRPPLQEKRNIYDQISAADELRQQQQDLVTRLRTELQARAAPGERLRLPGIGCGASSRHTPPPHRCTALRHCAARHCEQVFSVDEIERKIKVPAAPAPRH